MYTSIAFLCLLDSSAETLKWSSTASTGSENHRIQTNTTCLGLQAVFGRPKQWIFQVDFVDFVDFQNISKLSKQNKECSKTQWKQRTYSSRRPKFATDERCLITMPCQCVQLDMLTTATAHVLCWTNCNGNSPSQHVAKWVSVFYPACLLAFHSLKASYRIKVFSATKGCDAKSSQYSNRMCI